MAEFGDLSGLQNARGYSARPEVSPTKFCRDCAHFSPGGYAFGLSWSASCHAPQLTPDPVYGTRSAAPGTTRIRSDECGPEAKWHEHKPIIVQPRRRSLWARIFGD